MVRGQILGIEEPWRLQDPVCRRDTPEAGVLRAAEERKTDV